MSDCVQLQKNAVVRRVLDWTAFYKSGSSRLGGYISAVIVEVVARTKIVHQINQIIKIRATDTTIFALNGAC